MTTVDELAARVDALEQKLRQLGPAETLQPNYLTVSPAGQIGADFSGHVSAAGVDIKPSPTGAALPTNVVEWLRRATTQAPYFNPAVAAALVGSSGPGIGIGGGAVGELFAVVSEDSGGVGTAPGQSIRIINSDGRSDFLQLAGSQYSRLFWGQVTAAGAIARDGSGGWSVARTALGTYVVTYDTALVGQAPIPNVTPITTAQGERVTALSGASFTVVLLTAAGAAVDSDFGFTAIGRQA